MPQGCDPPIAAFGAHFDKLQGELVAALITSEGDAAHRAAATAKLDAWLAGANAPARVERAGERLGLELWHEVFVLPSEGQHFKYVNCPPGIGLLGYFPASVARPAGMYEN